MRHIIAGTAGHIDHGKTALVRALTGIETDRLEEEKRRGISIDLGFAHMQLDDETRVGFVDVPGHERFVKNMLAGAAGIDLVLFVIAADESIKPQTREHFDICRLLDVRAGALVLTKSDLVDAEILELVRLEAEEFVKGSFLEAAPIVAVSSVTGAGLEQLRGEMRRLADRASPKNASTHVRLPVDRAFTMRGFGAVVTGTLMAGSVSVEQEVEAHPNGQRLRVRGLQVHGQTVQRATAGQRTAVNVAGADASELARGMVLTQPGLFRSTQRIDAEFELLPSAKPLKHRAPVHFHAGTAEVEAEFRITGSGEKMMPGSRAFARFLLKDPLLLLPGDRFIVRMFSPVTTIGGGCVLDIDPPKRSSVTRLEALSEGSTAERIALLVRESPHGLSVDELIARSGLLRDEIPSHDDWLFDPDWFRGARDRLTQAVREYHSKNPLQAGMPKEELRARELPDAPAFVLDKLIASAEALIVEGDIVRLRTHKIALKDDEERALTAIERAFERAGLAVPSTSEVLATSGVETARSKTLLQMLLRQRKLVRVSDELIFHASAVERLKSLLTSHRGKRIGVAEFKQWTGVSRKYAIPLLEYLDRERVTLRQGDARLVL
jgi:selenocysteine-specific elongation factor